MLSDFTKAWQIYLGAFFIIIVMFAPGGIASLLMLNLRVAKYGKYKQIWPTLWKCCALAAVTLAGVVLVVEMLYQLTLESMNGTTMKVFGLTFDAAAPAGWLIAALLLIIGGLGFRKTKNSFQRAWGEVSTEIEDLIRRAQA
jgi:branched-chain amino acid transport system permease protein